MLGVREQFEPVRSRPRVGPNAFTLIELMVSIALVLILILGINQVFKIASDTVNAGQSLSTANRSNRGIQGVLYPDFQNAVVTGAPCFIIRSTYLPAFRNRTDELGDRDGNPLTLDMDGDNAEGKPGVPGEVVSPTAVHSRNHRLDELMFFASGRFQRQTGSGGRLSGQGSSNEAFIYYGHLQLPNNALPSPYYYNPAKYATNVGSPEGGAAAGRGGVNGNDNNQYASQWALGRMPILLAGDTPDPSSTYIARNSGALSPFAGNSQTTNGQEIQHSTCDVAQTSIANYAERLGPYIAVNGGTTGLKWYDTIIQYRFWANPFPQRPLTADKISRTTPIFVQGCTQFIVEYAGDFLAQDASPMLATGTPNPRYGQVTGHAFQSTPLTDGVTDFVVVKTLPGGMLVRKTRWYGMPRNVDTADDLRSGRPSITGGKGTRDANAIVDVVPLRDVIATFPVSSPPPSIEPDIDDPKMLPMAADYAKTTPDARYVAAWGPGDLSRGSVKRPTMVRITVVVDDPTGRMTEGQSYEYVFNLP
jgi:prepilin-type N-terminal cleavage/methylation domain-containing protein